MHQAEADHSKSALRAIRLSAVPNTSVFAQHLAVVSEAMLRLCWYKVELLERSRTPFRGQKRSEGSRNESVKVSLTDASNQNGGMKTHPALQKTLNYQLPTTNYQSTMCPVMKGSNLNEDVIKMADDRISTGDNLTLFPQYLIAWYLIPNSEIASCLAMTEKCYDLPATSYKLRATKFYSFRFVFFWNEVELLKQSKTRVRGLERSEGISLA